MKTNIKEKLKSAKQSKIAIPAFNVSSLEAVKSIFKTYSNSGKSVIIETSAGEAKHLIPEVLHVLCEKLSNIYNVDYALHLDRAKDFDLIKECLDAGYNSISGEFGEKDYTRNLELSLKARHLTNKYNAALEGVMEVVPLVYYQHNFQHHMDYTDPFLAKNFVDQVKPDSLVISIGTQSGKLKEFKELKLDILKEINKLLPELPLVLHGGSFLEDTLVRELILNGITKINVNSELRLAYTSKLKSNIAADEFEYAPYRLLNGVEEELAKVVEAKMKLFSLDTI